jgi:hypothetical protein
LEGVLDVLQRKPVGHKGLDVYLSTCHKVQCSRIAENWEIVVVSAYYSSWTIWIWRWSMFLVRLFWDIFQTPFTFQLSSSLLGALKSICIAAPKSIAYHHWLSFEKINSQ